MRFLRKISTLDIDALFLVYLTDGAFFLGLIQMIFYNILKYVLIATVYI